MDTLDRIVLLGLALVVARSGRRRRRRRGPRRRYWNAAEDRQLTELYPHERTSSIARDLRRSAQAVYVRAALFGLRKSAAYLASPDACRLRPGQRGSRWMPVGSTRLVHGYEYTKVSDIRSTKSGRGFVPWTRNWRPTHVLLWEKHRGPLPRGHALAFANGDRKDIRLENLELISRRTLMKRNSVHNLPTPLVETIQLLGALNRTLRRRTRSHAEEQDRRPA